MTQADRDGLVTLKKCKKKLITQREAAEELGVSVRHVKRLLHALKKHGDKAVIHGLHGRPSNRKVAEKVEREAVMILSRPVYKGFGPTLAAKYLGKKHGIDASKETVRQWMMRAKPVAREESARPGYPHLAAAPEPFWGAGAMGHQRSRLARGTWGEAVSDRHDRRCDEPIVRQVRAA